MKKITKKYKKKKKVREKIHAYKRHISMVSVVDLDHELTSKETLRQACTWRERFVCQQGREGGRVRTREGGLPTKD